MNKNKNFQLFSIVLRMITVLTLVLTNFVGVLPMKSVQASSGAITDAFKPILADEATTMFADDFNDGDAAGWLELTWNGVSPWTVVDGVYTSPSEEGAAESFVHVNDTAWTDYVYTGRFKLNSASEASILFRVQDAGDGYYDSGDYHQVINHPWGCVALFYIRGGGATYTACESYTFDPNAWYTFKIAVQGPMITYSLNNVEIKTWNMTEQAWGAEYNSYGGIGLKMARPVGGVQYDDILVTGYEGPPPVANPDSYTTTENTTLDVSAPGVLTNDIDPSLDPLTALKVTDPAHGVLNLNSNGAFTYTPDSGFTGEDTFTYQASDGALMSNIATVTITIAAPGSISGTVRDESGTPITGTTISVAAQSPDGEIYNWADSNPVDGTYTINDLPLNTNMLIVADGNDVYGGEYYEESVLRSLATVFNLTEAAPTYSNIDFTLPPAIPGGVLEQLTFNVRVGRVLNDPIIRKAIAYGTDRERILNAAWLGNSDMYGMALNSLMAPGYWSQPAYNQVNIYPYNPPQANALLDAAGIIDNDHNGIRETVGGGDIVLDFKTSDAAFRAASSAIFVENMAAIGIQVNVTLVPSDVFFSNDPAISPLRAGNFDIAEFAWGVSPLNLDDCYPMALYRTGNSQNHGGYSNATVDAEFDAAMAATDRASMLPHVLAYYAEVTDDMPSLPLFSRENVTPVTTTSGTNVLADLSSVGVRVTFQNATSGGRTAAYDSAIHPNDLPLNNTRVAVYEIGSSVTMATGTGATVCVNYDDSGLTSAEENKLQLHHLTMTGTRKWTNIFTSRNTTTNQVCGFTKSFSTFAVLLPVSMSRTFYSTASQDGWILESTEISNAGGTMNATAATLSLGDNNQKKQYRSILSFGTGASLPDTAVITKVTLKLKHSSVTPAGTNPITLLQGIYVDLRNGFFGTSANLQLTDFNAPVSKTVGPFKPVLTTGWYTISLNSTTFASINKLASNGGLTQIRLRFKLDDNNNTIANMLNLISGNNATPANRPTLIIEYYVP